VSFLDPKMNCLELDEVQNLQKEINQSSELVKVRDLQPVER